MAYFLGGADLMTGSKANDDLRGLAGSDTLLGGGGKDRLAGGVGADHLAGDAGADHFVLNAPGEGANTITDFTHGQDQIDLVAAAFSLAGGLVAGGNFNTDGTMSSTAPTLLYDAATGILSCDPDGTGDMAAVVLARLSNHATLGVSDFLLA